MAAYTLSFAVALGSTKTGLVGTLSAQLFAGDAPGSSAVPLGDPVTTGFTEIGLGNYCWIGEIPNRGFRGIVAFKVGSQTLAVASVNPEELQLAQGVAAALVNHNYGGTDALTYRNQQGVSVNGASITAYEKADYDSGRTSDLYVVGRSVTDVNGRWEYPINLEPGTYTLIFNKPGEYGPDRIDIIVSS